MPLVIGKILGNGTQQLIVEAPVSHPWGSLNVVASNKGAQEAQIEIFITSDATPNAIDQVEPGAMIPVNGRYELSCRLTQQGEKVYVTVPAGVSVRAELNLAIED